MAVVSKSLEVTWHFAEIDDANNEIVKTRKISFSVPSNAQASVFTSRFETFKTNYLAHFANTNSEDKTVGSLIQVANWMDEDIDHSGSNVEYKCVKVTAEFLEKTLTEVG